MANLVQICLKSTYFTFCGEIYEQIKGVAMGSPLSTIVATIYMEHFENKAIESFSQKPRQWKRFVDDTNLIWTHGRENLNKFLTHLNNQSKHKIHNGGPRKQLSSLP